jgi:hypothetical protein
MPVTIPGSSRAIPAISGDDGNRELRLWRRRAHEFELVGLLWAVLGAGIIAIELISRQALVIWQIPAVLMVSSFGFLLAALVAGREARLEQGKGH